MDFQFRPLARGVSWHASPVISAHRLADAESWASRANTLQSALFRRACAQTAGGTACVVFGCELSIGGTTYAYVPGASPPPPRASAWPEEDTVPLLAQVYRAHAANCATGCTVVVRVDVRDVREDGGIGDLAVKAVAWFHAEQEPGELWLRVATG